MRPFQLRIALRSRLHNPSLSVTEEGGKVLVKCFAGCSFESIRGALGLSKPWTPGAPIPAPKQSNPTPAPPNAPSRPPQTPPEPQSLPSGPDITQYRYDNAAGEAVFVAVRRDRADGKRFSQWTPAPEEGKWLPVGLSDNRPLWLLRDVLAGDGWVIVVEGEKCVQATREAWPDKTVTTWAGGTNAWQQTDWEPLRGRKVSLIADADPLNKEGVSPGHKAMRDLAAHLHGMGAIVKLVLPPVEWDSDVADWLAADGAEATSARIQSMLEDYEPPPPAPSVVREDKLSSEWQRIADKHADQVRDRFRFDIDRRAWWQWLGYRWIEVIDDHAITDILTEDRLLLAHEFERDGRSDLSTKL